MQPFVAILGVLVLGAVSDAAGSVCDENTTGPCVEVVVDMDPHTPGFQANVDVSAGTAVVEDVAVYIFDPAEQAMIWGIGYVGALCRGIAFGHSPANADSRGTVTSLSATAGVPVNPDNTAWTVPGFDKGFAGPEVHYIEWGAAQPAVIPADPAGPVFTVDIQLEGGQPGDVFDFHVMDFVTVWTGGNGGAFSTHGLNSLDTGGDAIPDGTRSLYGIDPDTAIAVPPAAFFVDYVDGGDGPATITIVPDAADFDRDGDVDLSDYLALADCFGGPGQEPHPPACHVFDLDFDGDVDLSDLLVFQAAYTGPR